jgi:predicted transposase/invertase (TIGR01784 family)
MHYEFKYADLLDDDVFKLVFGQESSKDVMIEFLNQVIDDRTIVDLDFMDKEMKSMDRERKDSVYDMFCKTDDGSRIVVEVQRRKQASYVERTIYYSTFQVRNQVDAGSSDYSFCPVYVINILDFNINENKGNPEVKTVYRLHEEKTHTLLTDKLTFIFLELNKFKKTLNPYLA